MRSIEQQTESLYAFIRVSAKRGRSEDEIIAWGRAPEYARIIADLENSGRIYHSSKLFQGVRYYVTRCSQ